MNPNLFDILSEGNSYLDALSLMEKRDLLVNRINEFKNRISSIDKDLTPEQLAEDLCLVGALAGYGLLGLLMGDDDAQFLSDIVEELQKNIKSILDLGRTRAFAGKIKEGRL